MRLASLLLLLFSSFAFAIEAHPPILHCSSVLSVDASVVGRWRGAESSIVPLRFHEALLRLPPLQTFDLLFLHSPALDSDMDSFYSILDAHPSVRLKIHRTNFEGHDWNYGPPSHDSEFVVVSGSPLDLIAFVPLVSLFDSVVLINPDLPVEIKLKEITPLLAPSQSHVSFEPLVDSPLAGVLGRIGGAYTLQAEHDVTWRVKFVADDFTFEETNQLPLIVDRFGGVYKSHAYLGSTDTRTGLDRSGAFFAEYTHLRIRSILAILGLSPHVRILDMGPD